MKLITLVNRAPTAKSLVRGGRQITIAADTVEDFEEELGRAFIAAFPGVVVEQEEEFGSVFEGSDAGNKVWIANITGNPDAPDMRQAKAYVDKRWQMVAVANPHKEPHVVVELADMGMQEYRGPRGDLEARNLPQQRIEIPAYQRREFDVATASWFLNRDAFAGSQFSGRVIRSRAPGSFEPSRSWSMDDILMYTKLIDPECPLGPSEGELRDQVEADATNEGVPTTHQAERERLYLSALRKAKDLALKRVYFRVVDPKFSLPTKAMFDEFKEAEKIRMEARRRNMKRKAEAAKEGNASAA